MIEKKGKTPAEEEVYGNRYTYNLMYVFVEE